MPLSLQRIRKGSDLDGDSGNDPSRMPDWMDIERFRRGQHFFQRHVTAVTFALHCSLTLGFCVANLLNPLVYTNKSHTPQKSLLRYIQTFVHLVLWHTDDVWDTNTMGHKSIQLVRRMHRWVRESMNKNENSITTVHVSQYDMALVQSGFMAAIVMYPTSAGVKCSLRDLEDYVFFWRGIGYLLGIDDEYNICSGDYAETYFICKEIECDVVLSGLCEPPEKFALMADAYIDGVNLVLHARFYSKESVIAYSLESMGHEVPGSVRLTRFDSIRVLFLKLFVGMIRWCPGFERMFNFLAMRLYKNALCLVERQFAIERDAS